jgi:hypothetical protein
MAKSKYKGPPRPAPLKAVLQELELALARNKADRAAHKENEDLYDRAFRAGYEYGLKRAIEIVNYEIGIRQNPPNIFYGMEAEKELRQRLEKEAEGLGILGIQ